MDPQRSYDPFGPGMSAGVFSPAPMPKKTGKKRRKKHPVRRFFRTGLLILLACLLLLTGGLGGAALYDALAGRTRTLMGETVVFPQLQADRENALSLPEVYETARPWVVTITCRFEDAVSYGTGFSLKEGGYIATCAHVVDHGKASITVTDWRGKNYAAEVLARDRENDVAVLTVPGLELEPAALGISTQVVVGETAAVIGNPVSRNFAGSMTAGIISARERSVTVNNYIMTLIQFDAAVSGGNSGGPLLNSLGQVIGMVNAKMDDEEARGIGFAIPIDRVVEVAEDLLTFGYVQDRPWLGITLLDHGTGTYPALEVQEVSPGSSAEAAGVRAGDWILAFAGTAVTTYPQLARLKNDRAVGDTVTLTILRAGEQMELSVTLSAMPKESAG